MVVGLIRVGCRVNENVVSRVNKCGSMVNESVVVGLMRVIVWCNKRGSRGNESGSRVNESDSRDSVGGS